MIEFSKPVSTAEIKRFRKNVIKKELIIMIVIGVLGMLCIVFGIILPRILWLICGLLDLAILWLFFIQRIRRLIKDFSLSRYVFAVDSNGQRMVSKLVDKNGITLVVYQTMTFAQVETIIDFVKEYAIWLNEADIKRYRLGKDFITVGTTEEFEEIFKDKIHNDFDEDEYDCSDATELFVA